MMFGSEHYSARAREIEDQARHVMDTGVRAGYIDLARAFREMANLASLAGNADDDDEVIRFAERMIGKTSGTH